MAGGNRVDDQAGVRLAMIVRIEALRYRSLCWVAREIGPFHLLVGPNGSGKSTLLDVVAFLADVVRAGPIKAILGDPKSGISIRTPDPLHLCWQRRGPTFQLAIEARIPADRAEVVGHGGFSRARYEVEVQAVGGPAGPGLAVENVFLLPERDTDDDEPLRVPQFRQERGTQTPHFSVVHRPGERAPKGWRKVISKVPGAGNDYYQAETSGWKTPFRLGPGRSALGHLPEDEGRFPVTTWLKRLMVDGVQWVILSAEAMRHPSPPAASVGFQTDGSNLPWVIERFKAANPNRFEQWVSHMRTALPELQSVHTVERPEDRHRYLVLTFATGLEVPSWGVSDGMLRLMALTLLSYYPEPGTVYLIEEPENGVHPRAIEAVYRSLSSAYEAQVLCATHSAVALGLASKEQLLCFGKADNGATVVIPGTKHRLLEKWKGEVDLGTLFAAGVL